jgi:hypothetical protein
MSFGSRYRSAPNRSRRKPPDSYASPLSSMILSQSSSLATRGHPSIARCVARAVQRTCWAGGRALPTASAWEGVRAPVFGSLAGVGVRAPSCGSFIVSDMLDLLRYLAEFGERLS